MTDIFIAVLKKRQISLTLMEHKLIYFKSSKLIASANKKKTSFDVFFFYLSKTNHF